MLWQARRTSRARPLTKAATKRQGSSTPYTRRHQRDERTGDAQLCDATQVLRVAAERGHDGVQAQASRARSSCMQNTTSRRMGNATELGGLGTENQPGLTAVEGARRESEAMRTRSKLHCTHTQSLNDTHLQGNADRTRPAASRSPLIGDRAASRARCASGSELHTTYPSGDEPRTKAKRSLDAANAEVRENHGNAPSPAPPMVLHSTASSSAANSATPQRR